MKKFAFPLERVLQFRCTQAQLEESKLERLYGERAALAALEQSLQEHRRSAEGEIFERGQATSVELGALGNFQQYVQAEIARTRQRHADCDQRIQAQLQVVTAARRNAKLLERLKSQRHASWNMECEREIAQQAEESHLAKWNRENIK